jgi:hypothetical protein
LSKAQQAQGEKRKRGRPRKVVPAAVQPPPAHPVHPVKRDAPEGSYFILCNGKPVKNLKELADVMDDIEDSIFSHHVRPEHNDFASWVKDIFQEVELAEKLTGAKDRKHFQLVLYKHIAHKLW